jgi:peptidoglycan/LPS O-acetylase OafA/YrhL
LIRKDAAAGLFSVTGFFSRRIRRIFPALFVVVIFSTAAGF